MKNRLNMRYSIEKISEIIEGKAYLANPSCEIGALLTDSRSLGSPAETLFFAISTSDGDGHNYVSQLYEHGVRNFVVERAEVMEHRPDGNFIVVENSLNALQSLAAYRRSQFHFPVVAITGSQGKTMVKEWLYELLRNKYRIARSPRSYNSQIGVALSLWEIGEEHNLAIIEAGVSTTGEMERLEAMIRPTVAVVTNVGSEHDEGFSSREEKMREKLRLARRSSVIVFPAGDDELRNAVGRYVPADVKRREVEIGLDEIVGAELPPVPYPADVLMCLAVAEVLGVKRAEVETELKQLTSINTRTSVIEGVNNCTLIIDGYTSDFSSLAPALDFMLRRSRDARKRTLIISDIDGIETREQYCHLSRLLQEKSTLRLIGVGERISSCEGCFEGIDTHFFRNTDELLLHLSQGDFENETILIKISDESGCRQIVDLLEASRHQTVEEIDLNALAHNFKFFKKKLSAVTKTVAMVKASGYGTGSYEVAKTLQDCGADYLAVAVQDEGVDLRRAGIRMPIIVLNPSVVNYKAIFLNNLEPEVYSIEEASELIREGERLGIAGHPVHVKLDTGMHRLGFTPEQLPQLIELLKSQDVLKPVSVFSHLCVADEPAKDDYTARQFSIFDSCTEQLQSAFPHKIIRHLLNTSGIVRFPEHQYDMVRIGIGLYGIKTLYDGSEDDLLPVASLRSVIISIKEWPEGTTIGYGQRGVLRHKSRIATVTIGYADGLDRHFGNGAISLWVNGTLCPTVGNVCMDAVMIDVTDARCKVGDVVEIFGPHVPIETLSNARGTIPYEILTSVSPRVKRVYFRE